MRTFPILALAVLALGACADGVRSGNAIVVRDSSGIAIVENDLLQLATSCTLAATPTLAIGEEDGAPEYEFAGVSGAHRMGDGRIVVSEQSASELRWYGRDGKFLRTSGRRGQGPGEFTNLYSLHTVVGDTLYAGNARPFQFLIYAPDGEWVRTVAPTPMMINSPNAFGVLDDGSLMLVTESSLRGLTPPGEFVATTRTVQYHGADGALTDTVTTMPHGSRGRMLGGDANFFTMPMFESYSHAMARDTVMVLGHGAERELKVYSTAGGPRLVRLIRWTGGSREVTEADIAADRAREKAAFDAADPRFRSFMEQMYETNVHPDRPIADVMPAMNGIRLGTDGRIWIREYQTPADTSARRWIGFTREGRFDCQLRTPRYQDFFEFGADYVLVMDADALGVERVKLFGITR